MTVRHRPKMAALLASAAITLAAPFAAHAQLLPGGAQLVFDPWSYQELVQILQMDTVTAASLSTPSAGTQYAPNTEFISSLDQGLFSGVNSQDASELMPVTQPLPCDSYDPMITQIAPALMKTYLGALQVVQSQETELQGENFSTIAANIQSPDVLAVLQGIGQAVLADVQERQLGRQQMDTLIQIIATDKLHQLDSVVRARMPRSGGGC